MTVAYLSHPLGESDDVYEFGRGSNIANAIDWFSFLRRATRWAICYPTMAYVAADSALQRPSQITGQIEIMLGCGVVVVCGWMNPHMRIERQAIQNHGHPPVIDLLPLGRAPPWHKLDDVTRDLARREIELGL